MSTKKRIEIPRWKGKTAYYRVMSEVQRHNECADGRHRYERDSIVFPGQKACRCGAVEGERPN